MGFQEAVRTCLQKKYVDFNGRALRSEFWYFILFGVILNIIARLIEGVVMPGVMLLPGYGPLTLIVVLALLLPNLAVGARRLHDIGKSGWWQLISLTIIGIVLLIYWWVQPGTSADNAHGSAPKASAA